MNGLKHDKLWIDESDFSDDWPPEYVTRRELATGLSPETFRSLYMQEFPQEQMSPPKWPDDREEPTAAMLFRVPTYDSDTARQLGQVGAYNQFMRQAWEDRPDERSALWAKHKSWVTQRGKILSPSEAALWKAKNEVMNLPATCKAPPSYDETDHPFTTMDGVEAYILWLSAWDMRIRKQKFNVISPQTFNYEGVALKFMGMETFLLEWVEWKPVKTEEDQIVEVEAVYYLKATDAGVAKHLYGLSQARVSSMFGSAMQTAIQDTIHDVARRTEIKAIKAAVERKILEERYYGTGMQFGAW